MSHYDTLGVPRDATAADIKAAFRRLASLHHPDRGEGDPETMAAVNRAHAVLSDPEQRAQYDATGSDGSGDAIENTARTLLAEWAVQALDEAPDDCVSVLRRLLKNSRTNCTASQAATQRDVAELKKRRGQYRHTGTGPNLIEAAMDRKAAALDQALRQQEEGLRVFEVLEKLVLEYEGPPKVYDPVNDVMQLQNYGYGQQESVEAFEARMRTNREQQAQANAGKAFSSFVSAFKRGQA